MTHIKIRNKASYQVGVDILGFPIYVEHAIFTGETTNSKYNLLKTKWLKVIQTFVKQH